MSVAIIQGAAGSQGLALASHILRHTGLKVYALTHGKAKHVEEELYKAGGKEDRLTVLGDVDVKEETGLEKAAKTVGEREGKGSVRLVACMAGVVRWTSSISNSSGTVDEERVNTGHLP
jgi:NAD(P)-dependent dehydrogenase (short-subunit alcohol dehydrogenase family)